MATIYKKKGRRAWHVQWFDHTGKRRERSTRTTDYRAAERVAAQLTAHAALRREGVVDASKDRFAEADRKPLTQHVEDYLEHCAHVGIAEKSIGEKRAHLLGGTKGAEGVVKLT